MKKKKILITGFPHSGTSILKSKMGECSNVYEHLFESPIVNQNILNASGEKEFVLVKYPMLPIEIRANHLLKVTNDTLYKDYIIVFVIRNPWNVFTSIIKSGGNPLNGLPPNSGNPDYHSKWEEYEAAGLQFINSKNKELYPNLYSIKYEDFFPNNFEKLRDLFNEIGLKYDEEIFFNRSKDYVHWEGKEFGKINSENVSYKKDRFEYRTWQINQPFQNMNSEVDIPEELSKILSESPIIKELGYTDPRLTH